MNGSHYHDVLGYFEWWYFHFASANGFAANVVLHETDIFGFKKNPYVSMSFQLANQSPKYVKIPLLSGSINRGTDFLEHSNGVFIEDAEKIEINIVFSEKEEFRVRITKLSQPLILNNSVLYQKGNKVSYWRLQVPLGHFVATLIVDGEEHSLEGFVYHDHQWGNISIQDWVSDWVWGHFSSEDLSTVFFAIQTQESEFVERYAVVSVDSVQSSVAGGQVPHLVELIQSNNPELWRGKPIVTFPFGVSLSCSVSSDSLMRSRVGELYEDFSATYLRWSSSAKTSLSDVHLHGITEYIQIRKEIQNE